MAENLTKIASSYDMVEILKKIGANYFGSDISEQRIGMFGYTTESLANIFGAAVLDASNRQREYNVCTAKKRSTLLYEGAKLDSNIDNAVPSKMTAYIGILTTAITNPSHEGGYGTNDSSSRDINYPNYRLVIEKDTVINIANYDFMFEHDIQIKATYNQLNKSYTYSVQYLLEGDEDKTSLPNNNYIIPKYNTAYDIDDKYIQSYVQSYSKNINILLFKIELVQINKESIVYPIVKNDLISLTGLDFPYSNNLSHFNISYRKNNTSNWELITAVPTYLSDKQYEEDVIFYETMHDEKKIRLNITDFNPAYNSELRIDIYNTMGAEPNNLTYSGDGSDIVITLNSLDERHSYTGLELNCKPISTAMGGKDIPTLEELRTRVIRAKQTINSMDTDIDLINYMRDRDSTNDCIFVKKRNDIIERRYSCYMIPRLIEKDIIPTSTLDLCIPNFKTNIDTEKINYYDFNPANMLDSISNAELYYLDNKNFIGSKLLSVNSKGDNDRGSDFYTVNEINLNKYIKDNSITENNALQLLDLLIPNSYNKNGIYTKNEKYTKLSKILNKSHITLSEFMNQTIHNNIIIEDKDLYKFNNASNGDYVFNMESKRYVPKNNNYEPSYYSNLLYKDKLYSIQKSTSSKAIYLLDASGNYLYNPLENEDLVYIFIQSSEGLYKQYQINNEIVYMQFENNISEPINNSTYIRIEITPNISLNNTSYDIKFSDKESLSSDEFENDSINVYNAKFRYAFYKTIENEIIRLPILIDANTIDETIITYYHSPFESSDNYKLVDIELSDSNTVSECINNPDLINSITNTSDYYCILNSEISGTLYYKGYVVKINYSTNIEGLKNYFISNLSQYTVLSNTLWNQSENDEKYVRMNTSGTDYFYKYLGDIDINISDAILYTSNSENNYNKIIENNFGYYIKNGNDFIRKILYQKSEPKQSMSDLGKYVYNSINKCYVEQIDKTDIAGLVYSIKDIGEKESITIKAGTPFSLVKNIKERANKNIDGSLTDNNYDSDTTFDLTDPGYLYPILSVDDFYDEEYSTDGSKFNKNNSLLIINRNETIDNGDKYKYNISESKGIYWNKTNESLEKYMKVYTTPYTIVYDIKNQVASYFLTSISKTVNMNMIEEENNSPVNFSIDSIQVERNSVTDTNNAYNITVDIITNGDISNAIYNTDKNTGSTKNSIMLKGFIYDTNNDLRGFFDFEHDNSISTEMNIFRFKGAIKITDTLSDTYCTNMQNMYNISKLKCNTLDNGINYNDGINEYPISTNDKMDDNFLNLKVGDLKIGIGCYYLNRLVNGEQRDLSKYKSVSTGDPIPLIENETVASTDGERHLCVTSNVGEGTLEYPRFISKSSYIDSNDIATDVYEEYILTNVYDNSIDLLNLFIDMSNFVKSSVKINELNHDGNGSTIDSLEMLHFTDIPVIQYSQCISNDMSDRISNIISNTHESLIDLSLQITNNFNIDYKFFRTYGPCRYFKLENVGTGNILDLGNLDINITFNLLIKPNLSISDNDVINQLKIYIKQRIEELNNETDNDDYTIYISNIITDIENEFNDYVRSIELVSINGNDSSYRIIRYNKPNFSDVDFYTSVTRSDVKEYVPEYINIPNANITINIRR